MPLHLQMASIRDREKGNFKWMDNDLKILCEICIKYIETHGRTQGFCWQIIHEELQSKMSRKCHIKSLKNKFDSMKKDWFLCKSLKEGDSEIVCDPETGNITASDEWWEKKISENPDLNKFRTKPLLPILEEYYSQIFEGSRPPSTNVRSRAKLCQVKRKRLSTGSTILSNQVVPMVTDGGHALENPIPVDGIRPDSVDTHGDSNNIQGVVQDSSISAAMSIVNRMVTGCVLEKASELWCFLVHLLENNVRREIFLSMDDDDARLAWVKYLHTRP